MWRKMLLIRASCRNNTRHMQFNRCQAAASLCRSLLLKCVCKYKHAHMYTIWLHQNASRMRTYGRSPQSIRVRLAHFDQAETGFQERQSGDRTDGSCYVDTLNIEYHMTTTI